MAKVTMPLFSASASGKIADAIVFAGWKGVNVVRGFVIPANPQSTLQGNVRTILGGIGRAVGKIQKEKDFAVELANLAVIPSGQTKQSYLVKFIKDTYCADKTAYEAQVTAYLAHTALAGWRAGADDLAIVNFELGYDDVSVFDKGLGLYLIAKAAIALGFTGAPYSTALASWTATEIDLMTAEFTTLS